MVSRNSYRIYQVYFGRKERCARIITFRVDQELNKLIAEAARRSGKSKSEFIRDSITEFIKFLGDNLGVEVDLQKHVLDSGKDSKRRFDDVVLL